MREALILLCILQIAFVLGENCLNHNASNTCTCCNTGFTGYNCSSTCPNCESRLLATKECATKCRDGYFGEHCDRDCSPECASRINSPSKVICRRQDGFCIYGCRKGFYGNICDLECSEECKNGECYQKDGRCLDCRDERKHGDTCSVFCSTTCFNQTCVRNGTCIKGCTAGFYGKMCSTQCGKGCKESVCTDDNINNYRCTRGCSDGYSLLNCTLKCREGCKHCSMGNCVSCMQGFDMSCLGKNCNCFKDVSYSSIVFIVFSLGVIVFLFIAILVIPRRLRSGNNQDEENAPLMRETLTLDTQDYRGLMEHGFFSRFPNAHIFGASGEKRLSLLLTICCTMKDEHIVVVDNLDTVTSAYSNTEQLLIIIKEDILTSMGYPLNGNTHCILHRAPSVNDTFNKPEIFTVDPAATTGITEEEERKSIQLIAKSDNTELLRVFLSEKGHLSDVKEKIFFSAFNCENVMKHLLEIGPDNKGQNVIHYACNHCKHEVVEKLLSCVESLQLDKSTLVNKTDVEGRTPIMLAARSASAECFEKLYETSDLSIRDNYKNNILHLAAQGGNLSIVRKIRPKFDIEEPGQNAWTPVIIAVVFGHEIVFNFLQSEGAKLRLSGNENNTLLHLACESGNVSIFKKLFKEGDVETKGKFNWTPLMKAAASGSLSIFEFLQSKQADMGLLDDNKNTLLHLACEGGNVEIVKKVLTPYSNIDVKGMNDWTPIMVAARYGRMEVYEFLKNRKADQSLLDNEGKGLLHLSCIGGNCDIVKQLTTLEEINRSDKTGLSPLDCAYLHGHTNIVDYLIKFMI